MYRDKIIELFQPLLEPIREGVIIADENGAVLTTNHEMYTLLGLPSDMAITRLSDVGGHHLGELVAEHSEPTSDTERHHCEMTLEFDWELPINGISHWFRVNWFPIALPCEDGHIRMLVLRDVTSEKRMFAAIAEKDACGVATSDPDMLRLIERLHLVAESDASVLIQGESGTGKTTLASMVHKNSKRRDKPFVVVNCGSIPASLIETELFGHVKGAFTGADSARGGRFKAADGGTLFLDEVSELPKELQPKLLRVLQEGQYEAVGSDTTVTVDVRVVAASNQNLNELVDAGDFRADLYYRIAVVPLHVPPLRDRPGDIPVLIEAIMTRLVLRGYDQTVRIDADAKRAMMNYPWPGNVRELANALEHGMICAVDGWVTAEALPDTLQKYCHARSQSNQTARDATDERSAVIAALSKADGNKTLAAQLLGVDRTTLWRRMRKHGIE